MLNVSVSEQNLNLTPGVYSPQSPAVILNL